jgi:hypothetical protein
MFGCNVNVLLETEGNNPGLVAAAPTSYPGFGQWPEQQCSQLSLARGIQVECVMAAAGRLLVISMMHKHCDFH